MENIVYEKSINKNIFFKSKDFIDEIMIKIGSLHTIGVQNFLDTKSYINSIEINDYRLENERKITLESLKESWEITSKEGLIDTIIQLLEIEEEYDIGDREDIGDFIDEISRNKIPIPIFNNRKWTYKSFNIQRATLLLRDGISCGLISLDEYNKIKLHIFERIEEKFKLVNLNEFIFEYLLGYYSFCKDRAYGDIVEEVTLNKMFSARVEGIRVLVENNYFENFKIKEEPINNEKSLEDLVVLGGGIYYEKNKRTPFEGIAGSYNQKGALIVKHSIKYGRFNGISQYYSQNGEILKMIKYENGKMLLGEFIYKKETNCFEVTDLQCGIFSNKVSFYIENEEEIDKEKAVEVCCTIYKDLDKWIEKVGDWFFENLVEIANEDWLDEDEQIEKRDIVTSLRKEINIYIESLEEVKVEFFIRGLSIIITTNIEGNIIRGEFS